VQAGPTFFALLDTVGNEDVANRWRRELCPGAAEKHSVRCGDNDFWSRAHFHKLVHGLNDRPARRDHVVDDET
jgi:hypothetical protein